MAPKELRDAPHEEFQLHIVKTCESLWKVRHAPRRGAVSVRPPDQHPAAAQPPAPAAAQLLAYSVFMAVGAMAALPEPWLGDTRHYWLGWPEHVPTWVFSWAGRALPAGRCPAPSTARCCRQRCPRCRAAPPRGSADSSAAPARPPPCPRRRPMMQLHYCLESSFYISSVVMLLLWEVRRKDFMAMLTHHMATVVLQAASHQLK
jgi:hypothetical protein